MLSPRPRVPRTTITALAVIVAVSAGIGLRQAVEPSGPATVTILEPQAPGDAAGTAGPAAGADYASSTTFSGSRPPLPPSRPPGAGPGAPAPPSRAGSGTTGTGSGPGGRGGGSGSGTGAGTGAGNGPTAGPTGASSAGAGPGALIWNGKPAGGQSQFAALDCAGPGSLTIENDLRFGPIWVFDKPAGDDRCEARGITVGKTIYGFRDDATYYIGWWSKVSSTANDDADFQWTSHGTAAPQDSPFAISAHDGHAALFQHQPGGSSQAVWTSPNALAAGTWHHYVVAVHTSDALAGGWIQLWYDGKLQTFDNGATRFTCRTWDVGDDPKWGESGAQGSAVIDYVYAPKVGTSYESVVN